MSQVEELERRMTMALDRIAVGVEALDTADQGADPEELARLKAELDDEKLVTAQLEERIKALHEKQDAKLAELTAQSASHAEAMTRLDGELQRLRAANEQLRQSNAALREANEQGVGEPHLINKAMLAELEGLRAARAADVAETAAILDALAPLVSEQEAG
jgi:predicted  nucleic acid-binding Zn-ribbon protein